MSHTRDQILKDVKEALKTKNDVTLKTLRLIQAEIKNLEIQKRPTLLEEKDVINLIKKQLKRYRETVQELVGLGRSKEAEKELAEAECLKKYLPPEMSEEELNKIIKNAISSVKAKDLEDQGLVIKEVQKKTKGQADGVRIVQLVRKSLQSN